GDLFGPAVFMRPTCVTDAGGAVDVVPLGTVVSCAKIHGGLLKVHTNGVYDECRLPIRGVKGVLVTIKSFAGYGSNMPLCSHFKGLYDGGSKRRPSPEQYLDLAVMVPKERPVLPPEHVFRLLPPREGSSGLAQETPGTAVGRASPIQDAGGRVKGRSIHTQVGPDAPRNTSDLHSQGTGTQRVGTPKLIKVRCGADTYSLRDETRRDSSRSGLDVGGNEAEGMGAVRESSGGEQTPSEKKSKRQRMVREEVAEGTLRMKRMRGKPEALMAGDGGGDGERASGKKPTKEEGGTASKKARRPGGLTIREGQAAGGGDSADPGAAAAREPLGKSKRKVAAEEGDGQKKPRRRKTAEAASGGEGPVGQECDEAAAFWLEYERNDVGEIVEKELPVQLLIDPRKVCDIPPWERYYNHRSLSRETVEDIKDAMLSHFREKKIWTKNPLVLAPIYKPVSRRPKQADRVSLNENTRHKMSKQRSQKAAFLDMRDAWENEGRPMAIQGNPSGKEAEKQKFFDFQKLILGKSLIGAHWTLAQKDSSLADKDVAAVGNALRQWMPLVTAGDDVFRKAMEFYAKWAKGKLLGGDGKTPLSEGATSGSLGSGDRHKLRIHSDLLPSPYAISAPHATVPRGQENATSWPPHLQLDTGLPCSPPFSCVETRDWRSRDVLEGPAPGVLEPGGSENERHTPGEDERSPGMRVVHREEETQRWQSRKVLETGGSKCERHASEGASVGTDSESAGAPGEAHAVQRGEETRHGPAREDVKWLHARALVIGTSEVVLHSRSVVAMTREGVVKGGKWTSVQALVLGDEELVVGARVHGDEKGGEVTVDIRTDPHRKDGDSSPTRCGEEQGGRASVLSTARGMVLHEAIELGDDSTATELVSDSGVAEMQNVESSVEGGEVAVSIKMDPERKDHDSPSTRCGAEQGDRASVLSSWLATQPWPRSTTSNRPWTLVQ
ncbi:hypothetical protein CBR_g40980, partial [Chara braunii]